MIERKRVRGRTRLPAMVALGGLLMFGFVWIVAKTPPPPVVVPTPTNFVAQTTPRPSPATSPRPSMTPRPMPAFIEPPAVYGIDAETQVVYAFHHEPQIPNTFYITQSIDYGHGQAITLSRQGDTLFIGDEGGLRAINVETGSQRWETPLPPRARSAFTAGLPHMQMAVSPDQSIIVVARLVADEGKSQPLLLVHSFESSTGRSLGEMVTAGSDWSPNLAISADNRFLILPLPSQVILLEFATDERHTLPNTPWVPQLTAVSGDGQKLLVVDTARTLHLLELPGFNEIRSLAMADYPFLIDHQSLLASNDDGSEIVIYTTMDELSENFNAQFGTYVSFYQVNEFWAFDTLSGELLTRVEDENIGANSSHAAIRIEYLRSGGILIQRPNRIDWFPEFGHNRPFYELHTSKFLASAAASPPFERGELDRTFIRPTPLPTMPPQALENQAVPEGALLAEVTAARDDRGWQFYSDGSLIPKPSQATPTAVPEGMCTADQADFCQYSPDGTWKVQIVNRSAPYMSMLLYGSMTLTNLRDQTTTKYLEQELPYENATLVAWKEDGLYLLEFKYIDFLTEPSYTRLLRIDPLNLMAPPVELWSEPRGASVTLELEAGLLLYSLNSDGTNPFELVLYNLNTQTRTILDVGGPSRHDLYSFSPDKRFVAFVHRDEADLDRLVLYTIESGNFHHFGDFEVFRQYPIQWHADGSDVGFFIDQRQTVSSDQPDPVQRLVFSTETGALVRTESMLRPYLDRDYGSFHVYDLPPLNDQPTYVILEQIGPLLMASQYRYNQQEPLSRIPIGYAWEYSESTIRYP